jgi:ABC-2 type transport system permease protein
MSFFQLLYYKLKIFYHHKVLMLFLLLVALLTAYITGYSYDQTINTNIPIVMIDKDQSNYSHLLLQRLGENNSLYILEREESEALALLKNSRIEALLILQEGFQENLEKMNLQNIIHIGVHIHSPNVAFVKELVASEVNRFVSNHYAVSLTVEELQKRGISPRVDLKEEILEEADSNWNPPLATYEFFWSDAPQRHLATTPFIPPTPRVYHGAILLFIMLLVLFGGSFMVDERNSGIIERLLASPRGYGKNHLINFLSIFWGTSFLVLMMILLIRGIFGISMIQDLSSLLIYILYTIFVILFTFLLGMVLKNSFTMQAISTPLTILLSFAGGSFFNMTEASEKGEFLSLFTPQGWALKGLTSHSSEAILFFTFGTIFFLFLFYVESKKRNKRVEITPSNS